MKSNKTTILLILIACLAAYSIFQNHGIKTDVTEYNNKIDSIQTEVDSVYAVNKEIDNQIEKVDNHIVEVEKDVQSVVKNITIIKNNTDEKVNIITTIGNSELEQLFADRYSN
jgi:septal ring factor EnvC (AmiA/AmiB activator)